MSFLDGHTEHWRWKSAKTFSGYNVPPTSNLDLADLDRLQSHLPK